MKYIKYYLITFGICFFSALTMNGQINFIKQKDGSIRASVGGVTEITPYECVAGQRLNDASEAVAAFDAVCVLDDSFNKQYFLVVNLFGIIEAYDAQLSFDSLRIKTTETYTFKDAHWIYREGKDKEYLFDDGFISYHSLFFPVSEAELRKIASKALPISLSIDGVELRFTMSKWAQKSFGKRVKTTISLSSKLLEDKEYIAECLSVEKTPKYYGFDKVHKKTYEGTEGGTQVNGSFGMLPDGKLFRVGSEKFQNYINVVLLDKKSIDITLAMLKHNMYENNKLKGIRCSRRQISFLTDKAGKIYKMFPGCINVKNVLNGAYEIRLTLEINGNTISVFPRIHGIDNGYSSYGWVAYGHSSLDHFSHDMFYSPNGIFIIKQENVYTELFRDINDCIHEEVLKVLGMFDSKEYIFQ